LVLFYVGAGLQPGMASPLRLGVQPQESHFPAPKASAKHLTTTVYPCNDQAALLTTCYPSNCPLFGIPGIARICVKKFRYEFAL
jgi:hypothetical protein